jgi:hypothetical protein
MIEYYRLNATVARQIVATSMSQRAHQFCVICDIKFQRTQLRI